MTDRIQYLNNKSVNKDKPYVLYWMQNAQRTVYNHALEFAIDQANELGKPLLVYFGLTDDYPEANSRHYTFMLQGIQDVQKRLNDRDIPFVVLKNSPEEGVIELSKESALTVVEKGYLKIEKQWRSTVAEQISCSFAEVETNVVVPVEAASSKEEYSAATLRRKINKIIDEYTDPPSENTLKTTSIDLPSQSNQLSVDDIEKLIRELDLDESVKPVTWIEGGTSKAEELLSDFIEHKLSGFKENRNEPGEEVASHMSPFLHFGHISPLYIYQQVKSIQSDSKDAFLEELIIRRELSMNFVYYNDQYDTYDCLPDWAKETLADHENDEREVTYTLKELEGFQTGDIYWNAAQKEMVLTGKMHGYMRMYWGKKMLEWNDSPRKAFEWALYLNNKYELDGRDANSFTGIAWCFGKHDRGWKERDVFGKVRYMNANGLERKFDMDKYLEKIDLLD